MRGAAIAATALGMLMLAGAAGCTRTSDGSIEMSRPTLGGLFTSDEEEPAVIVPSRTLRRQVTQPVPTTLAPRRSAVNVPAVSVPEMALAKNPPFKQPNPGKPISCKNSRTPSGRIKVVCA